MTYEWLDSARAQYARLSSRLPHALMIQGAPGIGKAHFAMEMVASLVCDSPERSQQASSACGKCRNCTIFNAGNHPDFHFVSSERYVQDGTAANLSYAERYLEDPAKRAKRKPRRIISVEQIRQLIEDFSFSQHSANHKVALIQPADVMNTNAANALLKLLEEPNPESMLILVCNNVAALPLTIRSRCISIQINIPPIDQSVSWLLTHGIEESTAQQALAISSGAPFIALEYCKSEEIEHFKALLKVLAAIVNQDINPITAREGLVRIGPPERLFAWLQIILKWLIMMSADKADADRNVAWRAYENELLPLFSATQGINETGLFVLYDALLDAIKQDLGVANVSLMLDKWLILFWRVLRQKQA